MAVFDTHRAFQALTDAGFSERQAQALIDVGGEGYGALATKSDLKAMEQATKADLKAMEQATKTDLKTLEQATKTDLKDLELRITLRLGALIVGAAAVLAVLDFLP